VLLVSGQRDTFSPVPELESLAREIPASELAIVPGTDHFFWRREAQVAERVGDFADRALFG
jgi:pimeloyl-ACP methyl ester carboxylesterase